MRILICSNVYPPNFIGGAELIAHQQAKCLAANGHEVAVFAGESRPFGQHYELREESFDGLTVHRVQLTSEDYQSEYINFCHMPVEQHFCGLLQNFKPDVVHAHNLIGLSARILCLAKEFGTRVVLTLHDHWGYCFKNTIMKTEGVKCTDFSRCSECQPFIDDRDTRRIPIRMRQDYMKLVLSSVDAFVSPSQYIADSYAVAGVPAAKINVVWNGVDVNKMGAIARQKSPGALRFSFFGYFGKHKGLHTLIAALAILKNQSIDVCVNLVGEGDQRDSYEQQLRANGCMHLVKFWGKIANENVGIAYSETDVLVLPSIWPENQPVSITEAMACGIPVIASNVGGIPELVSDNVNGFLFEAGNASDLADKMARFCTAPELLVEFGRRGKDVIRNKSFEKQVKVLEQIYLSPRSGASATNDPARVIACHGKRVSEVSRLVLEILPRYLKGEQPMFIMDEWLTSEQIRAADLIWVIDNSNTNVDTTKVSACGIPMLIPENNRILLNLCRREGSGLYYHDAQEAAACIAFLRSHPEISVEVSRNARNPQVHQSAT
jgi:glycosyltransferase involved in cell wall biosynthesis